MKNRDLIEALSRQNPEGEAMVWVEHYDRSLPVTEVGPAREGEDPDGAVIIYVEE